MTRIARTARRRRRIVIIAVGQFKLYLKCSFRIFFGVYFISISRNFVIFNTVVLSVALKP